MKVQVQRQKRKTGRLTYGVMAVSFAALLVLGSVVPIRIANADIATYSYNFNDAIDIYDDLLATEFRASPYDNTFDLAPTDGLDGTQGIDVYEQFNIWTTRRAFVPPTDGQTYTVSGYFNNVDEDGYGSIGFTTTSASDPNEDTGVPVPMTGLGMLFHGGGGDFINDGDSEDSVSWDGGDLAVGWYKMTLEVEADGANTYNLHFIVNQASADGTVGELVTEHNVTSVANTTVGGASRVYAYFGSSNARFGVVDDFSVSGQVYTPTPPDAARSYTNEETGDVFLGGDYIELGISSLGSFGTTDEAPLPTDFFGTEERSNIGMSTNPAGFGVDPDLRMDFFMPGSPEERWVVGYKQGGELHTGSNTLLEESSDIADNVVTDQSSGDELQAESVGTFADTLKTTQKISFNRGDKFFKNEVTLKNVGGSSINSVRYMRNFDPDNTVDQGGEYETHNFIPFTHQHGDGKAVVVADTSLNDSDPVYLENGSRSPIFFYSADTRARVSTFGFDNTDPYEAEAYNAALPQGTAEDADQAITITFDVGTLAPGQSQTFVYYTSLDSGDIEDAISSVEDSIVADATNDKNGDGIVDTSQQNVTSTTSNISGKTVALEIDSTCDINSLLMKAETENIVADPGFDYPQGLMEFAITCGDPGYTTTIKQYYYGVDPATFKVRKYNPGTNAYFNILGATVDQTTIYGQNVLVVTYAVTDNGELDFDDTPGVIKDPAGLGISAIGAPNTGLRRLY